METKDKFDIVEEDGVVVYDSSDDYDSGEDEAVERDSSDENDRFRLKTNEEIFTDEYMRDYAKRMDEEQTREKRYDNIISVCVIIGVIVVIAGFVWYGCSRYLH